MEQTEIFDPLKLMNIFTHILSLFPPVKFVNIFQFPEIATKEIESFDPVKLKKIFTRNGPEEKTVIDFQNKTIIHVTMKGKRYTFSSLLRLCWQKNNVMLDKEIVIVGKSLQWQEKLLQIKCDARKIVIVKKCDGRKIIAMVEKI